MFTFVGMENETKTCKTCKRKLGITSFYLRKVAPDRYQSDCKECYKEKRRTRYLLERKERLQSEEFRKLARQRSKESYRKRKVKNDKYWADRKAQKEINDLL